MHWRLRKLLPSEHVTPMSWLASVVSAAVSLVSLLVQVPAGLFIPSMFVGACAGRIMGVLVEQLS